MKLPYKPTHLSKGPKRYTSIVIHDASCQYQFGNNLIIDSKESQVNTARSELRVEKKYFELPYHFVCEKMKDDYETVIARPLQYSCEDAYSDLDSMYARYAIHICVMGNYNMLTDESRMYQQLCYRAITPMMRIYRIRRGNIFLHGELSSDHMDCPGLNFQKSRLLAYISRYNLVQ